jgi:uncharacterized protein with LGFP repeats
MRPDCPFPYDENNEEPMTVGAAGAGEVSEHRLVAVLAEANQTTVQTPIGLVLIEGKIHAKWRALERERTPDGDDVKAHLGYPLGAQIAVPERAGIGAVQRFQRGMIVERADGRTFAVYGAIGDHYLIRGGAAGSFGPPTSDEEDRWGGRVSHFEYGAIHWRKDLGVREVHGASLQGRASPRDPFAASWLDRGASFGRLIRRVLRRRLPGWRKS